VDMRLKIVVMRVFLVYVGRAIGSSPYFANKGDKHY